MHKIFYIAIVFIFISCKEEPKPVEPEFTWNKEQSSKLNRTITQKEDINIRLYLEQRPAWQMTTTGTGLRYWVYEEGNGSGIKAGDEAEIEYTVSLLNGVECYRTEEGWMEQVVVDQSDIETGLQEALKLLHVGDKVKIIVPSHLGHGLLGDLDKIPSLQPLIIDLTLLGITK